jgi:hypothetical protein
MMVWGMCLLSRCNGRELTLGSCEKKTGYLAEACGHVGDVGVICNRPIRCEGEDKV